MTSQHLTAAQVLEHPALSSVKYTLQPTSSGTSTVSTGRRGGPVNLYYEIHGRGEKRVVFIMGLNATLQDWKRQTRYFAHPSRADEYQVLVFDNRGIGRSDKPLCFYSTSEMAQDAVDLLRNLKWIDEAGGEEGNKGEKRCIHLVGASMGGMIAQEVAMLIPYQLLSLSLICTAPRVVRSTPFFENLRGRAAMFLPKPIDAELDRMVYTLFGDGFVDHPDDEYEEGSPNNFPTRRDRFAAGQLLKRADTESFTKKGFLLQVAACNFHKKSPDQLKLLADSVGRERIAVIHGTADRMLTYRHAEILREELGEGIFFKSYEGVGHMLPWEVEQDLNELLEGRFNLK
ncbi:hypothetical protein ASPZODRAFT_74631 [Penicilliopsis zonata CBS 506.65]|uniref:AB hydrolase-1 domain-containing protein n=1 Tax=Penicilliopsis zonata CBS 506.65 TaxID=1073090 RepID=A0A1L9S7S8_9EURO|nr:hypothetical protein ASPZODRAFT_74631 [Penicilliopsis zonata CBS 506.65]OJJ43213.1 hypothetical protein ASPZODRAFT_74631 [Penicilliopsis zonata CBS 506.65]